jgi:TolB protein
VAFVSNRSGHPHIYVMDIGSGRQTALTDNQNGGNDASPAWSPDGTRIAFVSDRAGTPFSTKDISSASSNQIFVMNADGSGQTQITDENAEYEHPSWQP